jgi:hypothetical protein
MNFELCPGLLIGEAMCMNATDGLGDSNDKTMGHVTASCMFAISFV